MQMKMHRLAALVTLSLVPLGSSPGKALAQATTITDPPSQSNRETRKQLKNDEKANKAQEKADKAERKALNTKEQKNADKKQEKADKAAAKASAPQPN